MRKKQPVAVAALSTEPAYSEAQLQPLLQALEAVKTGDFSVRLPEVQDGILSRIYHAFNEVVTINEHEAAEIIRVGRLVGREGRMTERAVLHNAAGWGGLEMVKLLLDLGASPTLRDPTYHAAPIGWAMHNQQRDVVEYLLQFADIFGAVPCDGVERVARLLQKDPSLSNARDHDGDPLVFYLHPEMTRLEETIQLLVSHGADINARGRDGRTLVDRALARGWIEFADLVRGYGGRPAAELAD